MNANALLCVTIGPGVENIVPITLGMDMPFPGRLFPAWLKTANREGVNL